MACSLFSRPQTQELPLVSEQSQVNEWQDEDGHAVVGDSNTPRFYQWVETFIRQAYPRARIESPGSWKQAKLPDGTVISWAEWGKPVLTLGEIDGLYPGKSVFVAMRDYASWVEDDSVQHVECSGTLIKAYNPQTMSTWDVHYSTILQLEFGNPEAFINAMTSAWNQIRRDLNGCP